MYIVLRYKGYNDNIEDSHTYDIETFINEYGSKPYKGDINTKYFLCELNTNNWIRFDKLKLKDFERIFVINGECKLNKIFVDRNTKYKSILNKYGVLNES